jgi:Flp pilus assembly protein protease CpaA
MISFDSTIESRGQNPIASMTSKQICWAAALAFPLLVGPFWCVAWSLASPPSPVRWLGTLAGLVLLAALGTCTVTDVRGHRIYNWTTYSAFLWAVLINGAASVVPASGVVVASATTGAPSVGPEWLGGFGIGQSLGGAALCFLITLAGYHMSGRGAGDVKLAAALGALLGVHHGVFAVAYSYIVAAAAIIVWSTWVNGPLAIVKAGLRTVGKYLGPLWPFPPTSSDSALLLRPIPLGPYFAIGTLLVVLELVPTWN